MQQQFSNWKCNTISKGWALFGRDYVSLCTCLCVRVCVFVLVCAHLHPPLAAESAKQRLRQRRRRQFVSCFPSADAAALATHDRSSVVVIREAANSDNGTQSCRSTPRRRVAVAFAVAVRRRRRPMAMGHKCKKKQQKIHVKNAKMQNVPLL